MGLELYGDVDPLERMSTQGAVTISSDGPNAVVRIPVGGIERGDISVERQGTELTIGLGTHRRVIALPDALANVKSFERASTTTCSRSSSPEPTMRERDSLTRLLARHGAGSGDARGCRRQATGPQPDGRSFDAEAKVRLLDASLEVLAALVLWRTLRRTSFENGATPCSEKGDAGMPRPMGQIPPMWITPNHQPPRPANRYH